MWLLHCWRPLHCREKFHFSLHFTAEREGFTPKYCVYVILRRECEKFCTSTMVCHFRPFYTKIGSFGFGSSQFALFYCVVFSSTSIEHRTTPELKYKNKATNELYVIWLIIVYCSGISINRPQETESSALHHRWNSLSYIYYGESPGKFVVMYHVARNSFASRVAILIQLWNFCLVEDSINRRSEHWERATWKKAVSRVAVVVRAVSWPWLLNYLPVRIFSSDQRFLIDIDRLVETSHRKRARLTRMS
jgi:hypothetical protein